jgi:hypothetical protein
MLCSHVPASNVLMTGNIYDGRYPYNHWLSAVLL